VGGRSQIIRRRESLVLYKALHTLWYIEKASDVSHKHKLNIHHTITHTETDSDKLVVFLARLAFPFFLVWGGDCLEAFDVEVKNWRG
jgi:hypothetical protein